MNNVDCKGGYSSCVVLGSPGTDYGAIPYEEFKSCIASRGKVVELTLDDTAYVADVVTELPDVPGLRPICLEAVVICCWVWDSADVGCPLAFVG